MNIAIINCFDTYEQRINMLYDFFTERKDNVKVYTSNYRHIEKTVRTNPPKNHIYIPAIKYKKNLSLKRIISHINYSKNIFKTIPQENIDLLWVLLPPNNLAKEAVKYKKTHPNTKLVFDVIDMWPETMPIVKIKNIKLIKAWGNLRNKNLENADYIITECNLFKEKLEKDIQNKKIKTIYFSKEESNAITDSKPPKDKIALCYLGSINNIIDIPAIAEIIKKFRQEKPVELHIIGDGESKDDLIQKATSAGAKIFDHGKIYDPTEKQAIFDSCHYGLNIMKNTVCVGLTMKSLDYFSAGLPIINNIKGDTWDLVKKYNAGINYDGSSITSLFKNELKTNSKTLFEKELSKEIFDTNLASTIKKVYA